MAWEKTLSRRTKDLAKLAGTAGMLYGLMQKPVGWVWKLYKARSVGAAELPATGVASTAENFVTKDPRRH